MMQGPQVVFLFTESLDSSMKLVKNCDKTTEQLPPNKPPPLKSIICSVGLGSYSKKYYFSPKARNLSTIFN